MARLLVVDDDRYILDAVQRLLAAEGYYCQTAVSAQEARRALQGEPFDMLLLDVGLPDGDGFTFCRQLRAQHHMPIMLLTARDQSADKVIGLEVGADDYLIKPFEPRELVARVRAHLRRAAEYSRPAERSRGIHLGSLVVDLDRREVAVGGQPVQLTRREFDLLQFLARHRERTLSAEWIFENVWGCDAALGLKTLAVYVRRLRCKIEADPDRPRFLITVRGFGYKLTADRE